MSAPPEPANNPKPVVKEKNPHNYRKVGFAMIVISVFLVIIALLVWAIGDDWHYSTNIMAGQEVDAMTPKAGYNIVALDVSQPVGSKLKLLDHADTFDEAQAMRDEDAKQNTGNTIQVLAFNATRSHNLDLMANAEVFLKVPPLGYNVILYDPSMPVGHKLTMGIHEDLLANATDYQKQQEDNLQGQPIQVLIFTDSFKDDLKMITSSIPPMSYFVSLADNQTSMAQIAAAEEAQKAAQLANSTNATAVVPLMHSGSAAMVNNQTMTNNKTASAANMTAVTVASTNKTNVLPQTSLNATTANTSSGTTVTIAKGASATAGKCSATTCFNPQVVNVNVGDTVTWTNADNAAHTATYYDGNESDTSVGTIWDSAMIKSGTTYTTPAFTKAGTYQYFCMVHPWMTGKIIVGASSQTIQPNSGNTTGASKTVDLNETIGITAASK
ncbi:MAG: cupredoxin domain-containing protein [Thaumarchaeota archaeon]|nr:cupredoxin domain-containing protein [Nitrososphaerota archaeon]